MTELFNKRNLYFRAYRIGKPGNWKYFIGLEEITVPKDVDVFDKAINSRKSPWMLMLEK